MILGIEGWIFWLILAVVFAIIEISTFNLVSIWFCGGSLAGMVAALFGADPLLQVLIAVGVSGVLLALVLIFKPFDLMKKQLGQPTNSDRVIGKPATVLSTIDPMNNEGTVKVLGQVWSAVSADDNIIESGKTVVVRDIAGVKLIVSETDGKE